MSKYLKPKHVNIQFADEQLDEIDYVAVYQMRTRTDLIREALRRYIEDFKEKKKTLKELPINSEDRKE